MSFLRTLLFLFAHQLLLAVNVICALAGLPTTPFTACKDACAMHAVKFYRSAHCRPLCREPCVYLCNHRGFADMFIDPYVTGGAGVLARYMTLLPNPFGSLVAYLSDGILFINRNKPRREVLQQQLGDFLQRSSLCVYPEGHRQQTATSLPLKYGIVRMAYRLGVPVQIVMTTHKEDVLSLQKQTAGMRVACHVGIDDAVYPGDVADIDEWCRLVDARWHAMWDRTHGPHSSRTATTYHPPVPRNRSAPNPRKVQRVRWLGGFVGCIAAGVGMCFWH